MAQVPFEKHSAQLSGTWKLVSWEMFDSEEAPKTLLAKPHGDSPLGRVVISQSGYLSAILVPPMVMAPLSSDDWQLASDEEVLRIGRSLTTYAGPSPFSKEKMEAFYGTPQWKLQIILVGLGSHRQGELIIAWRGALSI